MRSHARSPLSKWSHQTVCVVDETAAASLLALPRNSGEWRALHLIQFLICCREKLFNGLPIVRENRAADSHRYWRIFSVAGDAFTDSSGDLLGLRRRCLGKHDGKFVASVARRRIHFAAMGFQNLR